MHNSSATLNAEGTTMAASTSAPEAPKKAPPVRRAPAAKKAAAPAVKAPVAEKTTKPVKTPEAAKPAAPAAVRSAEKADKTEKAKKPKMVRDSLTMPKAEYVVIDALKLRAAKLGHPAKKTEVIRAAVKALATMDDTALLAALAAVPSIKTGRPAKSQ